MSRQSCNSYDTDGHLYNGYDYEHQCWVSKGVIQRCGHKEDCYCYGRVFEGETVRNMALAAAEMERELASMERELASM